jgi:hypothetical protein
MNTDKSIIIDRALRMKTGEKVHYTEKRLLEAFEGDIKDHASLEAAIHAHLGDDYTISRAPDDGHVTGYWIERNSE